MSYVTKIEKADLCTADGAYVRPATREEMDAVEAAEKQRLLDDLETANLPLLRAITDSLED